MVFRREKGRFGNDSDETMRAESYGSRVGLMLKKGTGAVRRQLLRYRKSFSQKFSSRSQFLTVQQILAEVSDLEITNSPSKGGILLSPTSTIQRKSAEKESIQ